MVHTSLAVTFNASQSILGRTLHKKEGLYSTSDCSSSASLKWRGKERGEVLHALTAQVRKLTVRIFIFEFMFSRGREGNAGFEIYINILHCLRDEHQDDSTCFSHACFTMNWAHLAIYIIYCSNLPTQIQNFTVSNEKFFAKHT